MSNSPRYVGFLDPPYNVTLIDDTGANLDLTGLTTNSFTLTMLNANTGLAQQCVGAWTVANQTTNRGQASYQWTSNDLATAGPWQVYTTAKFPTEPSPREFDPELVLILPGTVGAGAAPPGVLPAPIAKALFFNATDYSGVIQPALNVANSAGGGIVYAQGAYTINTPLIIYSNTKLMLAQGTVITLAPGSNCNMIKNAGATAQRSVSDATIASTSTTLTSATANFTSADVGRTVVITNAWTSSLPLVANITVVTNSTTVTLSVAAGHTVSGVACSIYTRDTNIEICGGYWQRGANGYTGGVSENNRQTMFLRHIDGLSIHDLTCATTNKGYHISPGDVTNYNVRNITFVTPNNVTNTDGVSITGPAQHGLIDSIYGTTGDDFVSVHAVDGDGALQDVIGNISDIVVSNLFPNGVGQGAFYTQSPSGTTVRSMTVRGVHGSCLTAGIVINDDTSDALIEDVDLLTNGNSLVWVNTSNANGTITLKSLFWRQVGSNAHIVDVLTGANLGCLTVDGLDIEVDTGYPYGIRLEGNVATVLLQNVRKPDPTVTIAALLEIGSGVTCSTAIIRNCSLIMPFTSLNTVLSNQGSLKVAMLDNLYLYNGGIPFVQKNSGALNCQCIMNNVVLDNSDSLAQVQAGATVDFLLNNISVLSIIESKLIALTGVGANMSVRGKGLINPNNYGAFSRDGSQLPRFVHPEMQADLATLVKNNGDTAYNTNAGLACGVGIAISNGSNWKNSYSGNIY